MKEGWTGRGAGLDFAKWWTDRQHRGWCPRVEGRDLDQILASTMIPTHVLPPLWFVKPGHCACAATERNADAKKLM
jgi:hypothetical protein